MTFLIDVGNSRIKWAAFSDEKLQDYGAVHYQGEALPGLLERCWQGVARPARIVIANVAGNEIAGQINQATTQLWNLTPDYVTVEQQFDGVVNAYQQVNQLGVDRWMAIIAAWTRYRAPVCIVDCGTAITIDVISATGQHMGGLIVPGIKLSQAVLSNKTDGIEAEFNNSGIKLALGTSTSECISNGTGYSVVALIERIIKEMRVIHGAGLCGIITGGYAEVINNLLSQPFDFDPYLVLNGLAIVADHN